MMCTIMHFHSPVIRRSLFIIVMIASGAAALAQQAVTRVEGFIRDEVTSTPIGVKVYVYQPDGKRLTINSNSTDGSYLVVLNQAGSHKFALAGHNVYKKEYTVDVPSSTKFQEIKRDFTVRELREGADLAAVVGFATNQTVMTGQGKQALDKLKEDLNVNQQMNVVITVTADEDRVASYTAEVRAKYHKDSLDWVKATKAYEKKYKKAKTKPEPPVAPVPPPTTIEDPNQRLLAERIQAVKAELRDVKNGDLRVVVKDGPLPAVPATPAPPPVAEASNKKSKKAKAAPAPAKPAQAVGPKHNTLTIKIGPVKRLFGE
jgi:hypothetical protein